jgi:hypothetical protein
MPRVYTGVNIARASTQRFRIMQHLTAAPFSTCTFAISFAARRSIVLLALALIASAWAFPHALRAQPVADTTFTWRGYTHESRTHLQLYPGPPSDENRDHTVVLRELAANTGPTALEDISYVAEQVGRVYGMDPARVAWVVHWGAFSYEGAEASDKEVLVRVTFRRTSTGRLSAPYWRIITPADLRELTADHYQAP